MQWRSLPRAVGAVVALMAASSFASDAGIGSVTAVEKVIQMLTDMASRAKEEKNAEAVEYAKFAQFCKDTAASKEKEISDAAALMEQLSTESAKLDSEVETLGTEIAELQADIQKAEDELKKVQAQREKDKASNMQQIQDLSDSVDALERAIATLQRQSYDRAAAPPPEAALLQVSQVPGIPEKVRRTIAMLMESQPDQDYLNRQAPEAAAYEFQSGSIVDLLKRLRDEFAQRKGETQKEEMNSKHAADMMSQDLHDQIENANTDISDKTQLKGEKAAMSADLKKRLQATTTDHDEAVVYLRDLRVECEEKGKSFKEKQDLRAEEIKAIEKAIEIMRSPEVMGTAQDNLPAASSLAQLRADAPPALPAYMRRTLAAFLAQKGSHFKSQRLGLLAQKIAASSDPFGKVKKMIEEMIKQLLREAGEEAEHKGWCDTELGTNKKTRTRLSEEIDALTARVDEGEATVAEGTRRMAVLAQEVSELQTAMKEATELRAAEKAKNEATIQDAKAAQKAVRAAMAILKDFYKKASTATALVQVEQRQEPVKMGSPEWNSLANPNAAPLDKGHREGMQTFGKTYTGRSDEAGGVLALLEVIMSDFAALEADSSASEQAAADEHRTFMASSQKSVAVKDKESSMLDSDVTATKADLEVARKDLAAAQDQLIAADHYYETLKPQCVDLGMSFEEREKARREEIESLQEALRILGGEELPAEPAEPA